MAIKYRRVRRSYSLLSLIVISVLSICCVSKNDDKKGNGNNETGGASGEREDIQQGSAGASNPDNVTQVGDAAPPVVVAGDATTPTDGSATQGDAQGTQTNPNDSGVPVQDSSTVTLVQTDAGVREACFINYRVMGSTLFTAYGFCQGSTESCVGGNPSAFDLSGMFPADSEALLPPVPDPAANCQGDEICCIKTDQCESVSTQLTSNALVGIVFPGIEVSCKPEGTCTGANAKELELGCPQGDKCCVNIPSVTADNSASNPVDAGT